MDKRPSSRQDRLIKQRRHDAYQQRAKLSDPTQCENCGALFTNGRWTWNDPPKNAHKTLCPACRRLSEKYPAGVVRLSGAFLVEHRDEIMNLVQNIEKQEKSERPMERIMHAKRKNGYIIVATTGIHIARRIGEALSRAFKGDLSFRYLDAENTIRVEWQR